MTETPVAPTIKSTITPQQYLAALEQRSTPKLWVVAGATGTGKTEFAIDLAKKIHELNPAKQVHVVNADAMQFYRGMNIGTAKIMPAQKQGIAHHLIDVLDVREEASVAWYQPLARNLIEQLLADSSDVILVGGSGLYVSSVIYDFVFAPHDPKIRQTLQKQLDAEGLETLLERLHTLNPAVTAQIDINNPRRVIRALEVAMLGAEANANLPQKPTLWYPNTTILGLHVPRSELTAKLDERVAQMWRQGLVAEAQLLLPLGLAEGKTASRAIGYQQAIAQLKGELTEQEAIYETQLLTRRYARRQVSWFKRYQQIQWLEASK